MISHGPMDIVFFFFSKTDIYHYSIGYSWVGNPENHDLLRRSPRGIGDMTQLALASMECRWKCERRLARCWGEDSGRSESSELTPNIFISHHFSDHWVLPNRIPWFMIFRLKPPEIPRMGPSWGSAVAGCQFRGGRVQSIWHGERHSGNCASDSETQWLSVDECWWMLTNVD